MKRKKKKINAKIIENLIPKDLNLSPIKVLSNTKKKVTNFYSEFKKVREREKIKSEKKRIIEKKRQELQEIKRVKKEKLDKLREEKRKILLQQK